jgi:hypothetical protein
MLVIVKSLDTFTIKYISRGDNSRAKFLARQASGYLISRGKISILEKPMLAAVGSKTDLLAINSVHGAAVTSSV